MSTDAHGALMNVLMILLDGNITYGGNNVPVYRVDVPETETGHYIILRPESGTGANNKRSLNDNIIIITDVVTRFENNVNGAVVEEIDTQVFALIMPTPQGVDPDNLTPTDCQVLNIDRENFDYLQESDGVNVFYRKISRYNMRIHQVA